ncbi:HD-GYP domain-containing protein [Orenia marismortui]|uniref:Metal dependent phosphohydrolase n=1 Tax=Orenia marismortui TaxID=46469 RepID=A0A4R8HHJ8_9FIRM|nr:HD-GYP domain-containing protein [Orenia marismortui]TDX58878.1 metal dependent phosphohydrolase [Orenia marismortui]
MRPIPVEELKAGMKIAKTIYNNSGQILLGAGMALKDSYIEKLNNLNIPEIYIVDEELPEVKVPEPISDKTRLEAIKVVKDTMQDIESQSQINFDKINDVIDSILDEILLQNHVVIHLNDIRAYDSYTFQHSVGVTILSILMSLNFSYTKEEIKKIAIGAFLHDIGKIKVDKDIIMKPGKLTDEEYEEVKKHSLYGYNIIKDVHGISILSAHIAYQHHEYIDGTGYPRGLKGDEISEWAQIVTVADIYDALTSDRVYKRKLMPHEALKIVEELKGTKLSPKCVDALSKHVAVYPVGTMVQLSDDQLGIVIDVNKEDLSSPIVRIVEDKEGNKITEIKEVDLIHNDNLKINRVIYN